MESTRQGVVGMKRIDITLSETESRIAKFIGKERFKNARSKGIYNARKGPQSDLETDLEGVGSELAAAKLLNLWPDLQIKKIPDHDLKILNMTIDVKTTKYKTGRLIAGLGKSDKPCDYYMLMIGSLPTYSLAGFAKQEKLLNENTITDLGWGKLHALDQKELISLKDFLNETN